MATKDYKLFDGANWISPCDQEVRMLMPDGVTWQLIDPNNADVNYFDGTVWKRMLCTEPSPPVIPITCTTASLSGQGNTGMYYIPMTIGATTCSISVSFFVYQVPDAITLLSFDKSTILAQTGFFGLTVGPPSPSYVPTPGIYTFGPGQSLSIYQYDPSLPAPNSFIVDNGAPVETITILPQQYPITNTNPLHVPNAVNPANPDQTTRIITWTKGPTATAVNIWIRIIGHPSISGTGWNMNEISCVNC